MRRLRHGASALTVASILAACGGGSSGDNGGPDTGGSTTVDTGASTDAADATPDTGVDAADFKGIPHVVIVVQENHTFDSYFGRWCTAAPGSNPTCTSGPACCEAAPAMEASGASPITLDDAAHAAYDPDHRFDCEVAEINKGKMDGFVKKGPDCADPRNFAIAPDALAKPYHDLASNYALADRYFQPIAGQSSSNDMYLAVAKMVFRDNAAEPDAIGSQCAVVPTAAPYEGQKTIADLLEAAGKKVAWYGEGYAVMKAAGTDCPMPPADCGFKVGTYPCVYDPGDSPFLFYSQFNKDPNFTRDYGDFAKDLAAGTLPDVSYVKALGYHSEHPGYGTTISAGTSFVTSLVEAIQASPYKDNTLILVTWDEGGGYYDHVAPPLDSTVDAQPYGTRVPLLAIGRYAKKGAISHVTMEHSSIVKFLEYNYLGAKTGQLGARDATVNNIGSLLDPAATGFTIPDR